MEMRPLAGVKVIDLTMHVVGPSAGMVLAEWGADVIKLEGLKGDASRHLLDPGSGLGSSPFNYFWELFNRNKRGICLDLHHPKGKEIAYRLVEGADVFLSNLRGLSLGRMGFDYETFSKINPRLIYAHATAAGERGPDKDKMGFEEITFWARAGIMALHGEPDSPPPPLRAILGDLPTGMCLAQAVVLGLMQRQQTGKGLEVNTSLFATGMYINSWAIQEFLATGKNIERVSRKDQRNPLFNVYKTQDGWIMLAMHEERFWPNFCRALGREDLSNDPRFENMPKRSENRHILIPLLNELFSTRSMEEWKARLGQYDLAWEPVKTADQVVVDPQAIANDYLVEVDHPLWGRHKQVASPIQFNKTSFQPYRPAPEQGQHNEEVLLEIGYSKKELKELRAAKVIK